MHNQDRLRLVHERLEFVGLITSLNPQFLDPTLIRHPDENGWTHPWKYFDSLRNYLLLTCFDILGQSNSFKDFGAWLSASSTESERFSVLEKAKERSSLLESITYVHAEYLAKYGARRAFYRFVQEVLPASAADDLFYSISIRKIDTAKNIEIEKVEAPEKKLAFLFDVRNSFTHKAVNTGSPAGGVFPNWGAPVLIDGVPMQGWEPIHWERKNDYHLTYGVRDWPNALIRTVEAGIASTLA